MFVVEGWTACVYAGVCHFKDRWGVCFETLVKNRHILCANDFFILFFLKQLSGH